MPPAGEGASAAGAPLRCRARAPLRTPVHLVVSAYRPRGERGVKAHRASGQPGGACSGADIDSAAAAV